MADVVFNRSHDVMQFLSWYCANTVPNLSLVISEIYDVLQRISEYFEYFESFQLNIQLEKGYPNIVYLNQLIDIELLYGSENHVIMSVR